MAHRVPSGVSVKGQGGLLARLDALAEHAAAEMGSIDAAVLTGGEAEAVLARVTRVRNIAGGAMPGLAARVSECGTWRRGKAASEGAHLGGLTGSSAGAGRRMAETGRKLVDVPDTKAALDDGRISVEQAEQIAGAVAETKRSDRPGVAERAGDVEQELLRLAGEGDPARLRDEAARAKQAARDEARIRRVQHDTRHLRRRSFDDGSVGGQFKLPADVGGVVWAVFDRLTQHRFEQARRHGEREPRDAYAADALCMALGVEPPADPDSPTSPTGSPAEDTACTDQPAPSDAATPSGEEAPVSSSGAVAEPKVNLHKELVVVVDADSLRNGSVGPDGTCEMPGVGPVPVQTARDLLGEAGVSIVVKNGADIANVTIGGRRLSRSMRLAMLAGHGWSCADCGTPYALQGDHDKPYVLTQRTRLDELRPRCPVCHGRKTKREAAQTPAAGKARAAQARLADRQRRRIGAAIVATLTLVLLTRGP